MPDSPAQQAPLEALRTIADDQFADRVAEVAAGLAQRPPLVGPECTIVRGQGPEWVAVDLLCRFDRTIVRSVCDSPRFLGAH